MLRPRFASLALLGLALAASGCGAPASQTDAAQAPATPDLKAFPKADGKTLADLHSELGPGGPVLAPSVSVLEPGETNRMGFGLFDRGMKQITDASVVIYAAPADGGPAEGPYPARSESLDVKPQYASRTTTSDPDAAHSVYVADVPIKKPGQYEFIGAVNLDGRVVAADPASPPLWADPKNPVPDVGDASPSVDTPTYQSVGGDMSKIETRDPPAESLLDENFADVLGKQPVVLVFATPALCASRVCGPVTDIALQVSADAPGEVAFIHSEIYQDNDPNKGVTKAFGTYVPEDKRGFRSEPWVFVIGADGKIVDRLEGAFSPGELTAALNKL